MKSTIEQLRDVVAVQCSNGNWNANPYMHGMANGLILALAIMEDKTPQYLDAPEVWLSNSHQSGAKHEKNGAV